MEHWIEVNLFADLRVQSQILLDVLKPYVDGLKKRGELVTWHYFREPEIRFRVRLRNEKQKTSEARELASLAASLQRRKLISRWHFGNHGRKGQKYTGEEDRYGRNGWRVAQDYFNSGAEVASRLLALRRGDRLESPLWARGLGNPWEGGKRNPWREREENPFFYHWSRFVHLFTNQLGFDMNEEARLCSKQAARYRKLSRELGMKW